MTVNPPKNRDENRDPKIAILIGIGVGVASPITSSPLGCVVATSVVDNLDLGGMI
ncbi:hypothetical protein TIFTF001_035920 [Ficus carica]|uniref:Uncharacterized protein n=1 Tax=Ficus carica TaxID=3494 RepID=A0AA88E493_FICCA|nr:hypothetical protein TIFTF001_035920 [Ficus carica]